MPLGISAFQTHKSYKENKEANKTHIDYPTCVVDARALYTKIQK